MPGFEITEIPPLPTVTMEVMRFDPMAESASSASLERIVAGDKGISSNILKVANSAFFGRSGSVKSLRDAITLLGLKAARNLIILLATKELFGRLKAVAYRSLLHEYPIVCALSGLDVCKPLGLLALREEAFTCGLLHNIGMSVLALNTGEKYKAIAERANREPVQLHELEMAAFGKDHHEIGEKLFENWKLPETYRKAVVGYNYQPEEVPQLDDLVCVTGLASMITRRLVGLPELPQTAEKISAVLKRYGKPEDVLEAFNDDYYQVLKEHPFYQMGVSF
ncbi:MAG: HDOD domain-containing protein [Spirochaetales bacterium]|nr:HDOD domain-containing protein [Leptospiraceae bacterium]MCP5482628.1 HDOD domain-containing protein [Spirochaetales bacterium]MCP5485009.1 HDOD domain-containing protein [Spirochaetales bacterium]